MNCNLKYNLKKKDTEAANKHARKGTAANSLDDQSDQKQNEPDQRSETASSKSKTLKV